MQLEKLGLLEKRLNRFIERFEQLKQERELLLQRLEAQAERVKELEEEIDEHRQRENAVRARIDRIVGVVARLEDLERSDTEATQ